ncbi:hypothetical protein HOU00_gp220 [Caulobacter phage CcrPW]|uniref:Methyltransferase n=1 Tax=Caulobacter phage CcrPW TaxID=2283271 RepID=A0A385ED30_9CAUD|nr:hypothetical protein HOU00_gp220 [Caulobacter phage CcrPW]AXQ68905.1 hypothetical protein CcrPW_gp366 [Caulobacter phage CcrPW]
MTITSEAPLLANETPSFLVGHLLDLADVRPGHTVLEPSAGDGRLAFEAVARGADVTAIELNQRCCESIAKQRDMYGLPKSVLAVRRSDFLMTPVTTLYDRVVMNPPRANVPHVTHAYSFLKPGGRLVALIHREHAEAIIVHVGVVGDAEYSLTTLPADMFQFDGKPIEAAFITLWKPHEAA